MSTERELYHKKKEDDASDGEKRILPGMEDVEGLAEMEAVAERKSQKIVEESGAVSGRDGRDGTDEEKEGLLSHKNLVKGI